MSPDNPQGEGKPGRRHMEERALSRFGLEIGKIVRQTLLQRVHEGNVKYARRLTHSRTVIVLDYAGRELAFIYSNASKEILTFLLPDAPETEDYRRSRSVAERLFGGKESTP